MKEIEQEIEKVKMKKTQQFMLKNSRMLNLRDKQTKLEKQYEDAKNEWKTTQGDQSTSYLKKILVKSLQVGQVYHLQKLMKLNRIDY